MHIWDYKPGELPATMKPLLGAKVRQAWAIPPTESEHGMLVVQFENQRMLQAEAVPAVPGAALAIKVGTEKDGADWSFLDKVEQPRQARALVGRRFTGIDATVLMFGSVGARITLRGVEWVREP